MSLTAAGKSSYHRVDPDQVWVIASVEVPNLAEQLAVARPTGSM